MDAMTTAECIHVYQHSRLQSESFTPEAVAAAYVAGLAALQEKAEADKPLTLEELEKMGGKPVWIVEYPKWGHWELSEYGEDYLEDRDPDFYGMTAPESIPDPLGKYGLHALGWLAYTKEPEVTQDGKPG